MLSNSPAAAFQIAQRFVGMKEVPGAGDNVAIVAMLRLDVEWPEGDEVPWCSAFANYVCWLCRQSRSRSLRARSWLRVGRHVGLGGAQVGDIVVLKRRGNNQPGPEVIKAQGHVGFFAGQHDRRVEVLGGNQGDAVSVASFPVSRVLSVRRVAA